VTVERFRLQYKEYCDELNAIPFILDRHGCRYLQLSTEGSRLSDKKVQYLAIDDFIDEGPKLAGVAKGRSSPGEFIDFDGQ